MAKPSIFSKDYQKKMKRRRQRITFFISISVIVVIFAAASIKGIFKNLSKDVNKVKSSVTTDISDVKNKESAKPSEASIKKPEKTEGYAITLNNGKNVNAVYEAKNGDKVFKCLLPTESNVAYSISPSGKNMVFFDDKIQSIILMDVNGNKQDITNKQYTSSTGVVITKEAQISSQPNYMWCSSPKFIDENNIVYISQLPWVGKTTKYIWIETITNKTHALVQGIQGEDVKFDKLTDKGLTVILDGKTVFITANGTVTE